MIRCERRHLAAQIQQRAFEFVPYIPTGQLVINRAFRKNLAGVIDEPGSVDSGTPRG